MIASLEKKYNIEAGISTALIVLMLFLLIWFFKLRVPDPPINDRGGKSGNGEGGLELAYAPVEADKASSTPSSQPETPTEETPITPAENSNENQENTDQTDVIQDQNAENTIVIADKKKKKSVKTTDTPHTSTDIKIKPKRTAPKINTGDLFDGDDDGGGSPDGNSNKGSGSDGGNSPGLGVGVNSSGFGENGWGWAKTPKTDVKSQKNGQIVFKVEIDEKGKVTNVVPSKYTVDYDIMQNYLEECYKLKFVRKNDIDPAPNKAVGYITFNFKAR